MPYADRIYRPDKRSEPYFWPNEQHEGLFEPWTITAETCLASAKS